MFKHRQFKTRVFTMGRSPFWTMKIMPFVAFKKGVQYK
uniref:Uncharacterized protein n=1 Tax=Siphoviridae sp. ctrCN24 TaxID=2827953 RepID=A0A8S5SKT2_9CAUD|nr:MAG TPA: hypothetical protein [Siphoviridae sp. ctrCN24]